MVGGCVPADMCVCVCVCVRQIEREGGGLVCERLCASRPSTHRIGCVLIDHTCNNIVFKACVIYWYPHPTYGNIHRYTNR